MKKATFLLAISLSLFSASFGQFKMNAGIGSSFGRSVAVEAGIGYNWKLINITGAMQAHTSNSINQGALFELKAGHEVLIGDIIGVNPFVGYGYHYGSADRKGVNTGHPLYGIEVFKMFREDVGIYGMFSKTGRYKIVSFGLKGYF